MKRLTHIGLVAVVTVALFTAARADPPAPNVTGTWDGAWLVNGQTGELTLRLMQDGENVRGTYDVGRSKAGKVDGVPLRGTLKGDELALRLAGGTANITFEGQVTGDTIRGHMRAMKTMKNFTLTRQP